MALEWLRNVDLVRSRMASHQVERKLEEGGGFCKISTFLPNKVALAAHDLLAKHSEWETMNEGEVAYQTDTIDHCFQFAEPADHPATLGLLADAIALLFEDLVPSFSAAKYGKGDCIAPHDDKAHVSVESARGRTQLYSRKYAGILYLTRGWKARFGGALLDFATETEHVPTFNTLIVFEVPRMHAVAPVLIDGMPRLSVFGWWLKRGRLYELDATEPTCTSAEASGAVEYADLADLLQQQDQELAARARAGATRRKLRKQGSADGGPPCEGEVSVGRGSVGKRARREPRD